MIFQFVSISLQRRWVWLLFLASGSVLAASLGHLMRPAFMEGVSDLPSLPFAALARWDSGWYGAIAARGYWLNPDQQSPVAYFPLYPLLMRGLSWLGVNRWVAGSILSMGAALTAFFMFHRWAAKIAAPHALTAWLLLISYPYACYLYGTVYSDAVFLLLAVSAFIALESEAPVLSAFLGALACACRPIAPAVVIGLLVRSLERRKTGQLPLRAIDFVPALSGLGLAAYMFFLWTQFGDPLAFAHVHNAPGWEQPPGWASWLKDEFFHQMRVGHWTVKLRLGAHAFVTIGAMALVPATIRRVGWGYGLYCLVALALPAISSKDFQGMGRYAIGAFPLLIPMAAWLDEWAGIRNALLWVLPLLLGLCAGLLGTGAYVS